MRISRSKVVLVELIVLCSLVSALGVSVLAGDEYQVTAIIESPEPQSDSYFGFPVDLCGDTMVVGESWISVEGFSQAGRAHIYDINGTLRVTLQSPTPQGFGWFGRAAAISGDIIIVGEPGASIEVVGRVYIYNSDGSLRATLQSPDQPAGGFGRSLCFCGDTIVVGEPRTDVEGKINAGRVHLHDSDGNFLETLQSPEPVIEGRFGFRVGGSEDLIVVSEHYAKVGDTGQAGKAYIFDSDGDLLATLQSPDPQYNAGFSRSVAVSGDIVVVGEYYAEVNGQSKAGRAHVFDTDGNLLVTLQSPEPEAYAMFGSKVDTSGDLILVGEPSADGESNDEGRAYVFDTEGNLLETLSAPEPTARTEFGSRVFVKGEIIVVGEYGAIKVGRLYVFQPGAAYFTSSGLTIDPGSVRVGDTVTITVECCNEGSRADSHTVTLKVDGEVEDEKTVTLDPGLTTTVSFEVSATEEGSHSVDVSGLTGSYEVRRAQTGIPGFPVESIIAGLAIASLAHWLHRRRS
jgi:hypothetical protein